MEFDELSNKVIGCAIEVHRNLGPGLLESAYEQCLSYELLQAGIGHQTQKEISVKYKEITLDCGYKADIMVEDKLIVELKAVDKVTPVYEVQILTYMKLTNIKTGLLINFNVKLLKDGIKRFVL
ncbi:MAG TPA: GxxExxY protein [Phycisphaerales bacterium]|nr:GxxExxY protein [Phycisphaerales bacterium]